VPAVCSLYSFSAACLLDTGSQGYDTQGGGGERYEEGKSGIIEKVNSLVYFYSFL
jgi:hypothetical protein